MSAVDPLPDIHIGTSGYQYDHWRQTFYPANLPKRRWFEHYRRHFDTVEINNTFYHLPDGSTFEQWREQATDGFRYVLKFSRYGSHLKCLKDPNDTVGLFWDRARLLGPKLDRILVQLKPNWSVDTERLRAFLEVVPDPTRWAFEFRDPSWLCRDVFGLLRHAGAALCVHDLLPDHPMEITADWVYLRFHGDHYAGAYGTQYLTALAGRIAGYQADGLAVYAFFNNDAEGHAVHNALDLKRYVARALSRRDDPGSC